MGGHLTPGGQMRGSSDPRGSKKGKVEIWDRGGPICPTPSQPGETVRHPVLGTFLGGHPGGQMGGHLTPGGQMRGSFAPRGGQMGEGSSDPGGQMRGVI